MVVEYNIFTFLEFPCELPKVELLQPDVLSTIPNHLENASL